MSAVLLMACCTRVIEKGTTVSASRLRSLIAPQRTLRRAAVQASAPAPRCWTCVKNCGACCYLAPEERPGLSSWLSQEDYALYLTMVGEDGWCVHYDKESRGCTVYDERPWFCRVSSEHFAKMFRVKEDELDEFAIECCREHIDGLYGSRSAERKRFESAIVAAGAEAQRRKAEGVDQRQ